MSIKKWLDRSVVVVPALLVTGVANAADSGIGSLFDSVDLSDISSKILSIAVIIVGIALVIKGPSIVKRLIEKI